jgi:murein DD-endopeptidase MepM/ murein hydrolase activator NlpD
MIGPFKKKEIFYGVFIALSFVVLASTPLLGWAQTAPANTNELIEKIKEKSDTIGKLEQEIKEYEAKLTKTKTEAKTLTNAVVQLDTTRKKITTEIVLTENKIEDASLNIERLSIDINDKEAAIARNEEALAQMIRLLRNEDKTSMVKMVFFHDSFSDFWNNLENITSVQKNITQLVEELKENKNELEGAHNEETTFKKSLETNQVKLSNQKKAADIARDEKNKLLAITKNQQSNYQKILDEKVALKKVFEAEMSTYEAALKSVLPSGSVPTARSGVLTWPLKKFVITQYFGNTPFATQNPQVYSGKGHAGIDLAAPLGTPIYAAAKGKVLGTGNTDTACPNASYGRWVFIGHENGLSTLYAHLSYTNVSPGQNVTTDDIIGNIGSTGYSTGPHLHFTVFAENAVAIGTLQSKGCKNASYTIPLLTKTGGYLNPLSYLPAIP